MEFWRKSRKSRKDKTRNLKIREIMNVQQSIIEVIDERQLRCFGHFNRKESDITPKMILEWNIVGSKIKGKPRKQ